MRCLSLLVLLTACGASMPSGEPPASVRDRLALEPTALSFTDPASGGAVTAARKTSDGWTTGTVELAVRDGDLVVSATPNGDLTLESLAVAFEPIDVPASVLGYEVQLTDVRFDLAEPQRLITTWDSADAGHATAELALALSWSLTNHGTTSPLGSPELPRIPAELVLTGTGDVVHGELRVSAPGELWQWADLLAFDDLALTLAGDSDAF
jgi:hypothetical protein